MSIDVNPLMDRMEIPTTRDSRPPLAGRLFIRVRAKNSVLIVTF